MKNFPVWVKNILKAAGAYNILWGSWVVLFPFSFFQFFDLPVPVYPMIWQSVGMIVGVYGIGYYIAAHDPQRHWPIIFVGWLGKLFGPIGALYYLIIGKLTPWFLLHNLTNDIIWFPFFTIILYYIVRNAQVKSSGEKISVEEALEKFITNKGNLIAGLNQTAPVMLIFLRHFGCTFCRETLFNLKKSFSSISKNCKIVIIHMSNSDQATLYFDSLGLPEIEHISDTNCSFYKAFELRRGNFYQLFGPKVWWRGFNAGILKKHGIGKLQGDGFQMPGVFILYKNKIIEKYYYNTAADQPDLIALAKKIKLPVPQN
ncbi:MAG: SelL-related redox protein [Cyclobacteriaceae bacterium]